MTAINGPWGTRCLPGMAKLHFRGLGIAPVAGGTRPPWTALGLIGPAAERDCWSVTHF